MKWLKRILSATLAGTILLAFAACGGEDDNKGGKGNGGAIEYGRYVETDITPEGMTGSISNIYTEGDKIDLITMKWVDDTGERLYNRYSTEDGGKNWTSGDMSWTENYSTDLTEYYSHDYDEAYLPDIVTSVDNIILLPNGDLIATIYTYETTDYNNETQLLRIDKAGNASPFELQGMDQMSDIDENSEFYINQIQTLSGNRLLMRANIYNYSAEGEYLSDQSIFGVYDLDTGAELFTLSDIDTWDFFCNDNYLIYEDYNSNSYKTISLTDGSVVDAPIPSLERFYQQSVYPYSNNTYVDNDNNFFTLTSKGLYKVGPSASQGNSSQGASESDMPAGEDGSDDTLDVLAAGGNEGSSDAGGNGTPNVNADGLPSANASDSDGFELVMEGLNYRYGSPRVYANIVRGDGQGGIYIAVESNNGDGMLLRYDWDDDAIARGDQHLNVYALYDSETMRLALNEFKIAHPEVTVSFDFAFNSRYEVLYPEDYDNVMNLEDALRALNTELLAGNGPDVLLLDDLPMEGYIEKGVLENISSVTDGVNLYDNILEPFFDGGKLYAAPTRFVMPMLFGEKGDVDKYTDLDTLVSAIVNGPDKKKVEEPDWENMTEADHEAYDWDAYYSERYSPSPKDEQPIIYYDNLDSLVSDFYETSAPAIYTEKNGLNQNELKNFLEAVKAVSDKYELMDNDSTSESGGESWIITNGGLRYSYSSSQEYLNNQQARVAFYALDSFSVLQQLSWSNMNARYYSGGGKTMSVASSVDVSVDSDDLLDDVEPLDDDISDADEPQSESSGTDEPDNTDNDPGDVDDPDAVDDPNDVDGLDTPDNTVDPDAGNDTDREDIVFDGILAPGLSTGVFRPAVVVGVCSTSQQKELATAFVASMLQGEVQNYSMYDGLPVNRDGFAAQYSYYLEQDASWMRREGIDPVEIDFDTLISQLTVANFSDNYLLEIIYDYALPYCKGEMSLDAAVDAIVTQTNIYFAEKQ